mmetsp:Transcript_62987/g.99543  ORF Transcript_62987/g.99543 Transcript_62987/m.99543 type:complete len:209 (-) Transcript_62987:39-665(-)
MLPIGKVQVGRDWMQFFTVLVWTTIIAVMFLSKLKAAQDVMLATIMALILLIVNADTLFKGYRFYSVYRVLSKMLHKECYVAGSSMLACLIMHRYFPESKIPGMLFHLAAVVTYLVFGVQTTPMVSGGLLVSGTNQMKTNHFWMHVIAQGVGILLAATLFGFYYSFRFPRQGPFHHFFCWESACASFVPFIAAVAHARREKAAVAKKE